MATSSSAGRPLPAIGEVLAQLLKQAHIARAADLPELLSAALERLGAVEGQPYLADLQQRHLVPFIRPAGVGTAQSLEALPVDSTLAGRSYQHLEVLAQEVGAPGGGTRWWLPLVEGVNRLGVLSVTLPGRDVVPADHGDLVSDLESFASLAAQLIVSKGRYGDTILNVCRTEQMSLAAEMQWGLLPPLACETSQVSVAAVLEPAYEVGGDSVDHAIDGNVARLAVLDGMGHGLPSSLLTSAAITAYRSARRAGRSIVETVKSIDVVIETLYRGDAFTTGLFAEIDLSSGIITWVNAGHYDALLFRDSHLVKALKTEISLPCGLIGSLSHGADGLPVGSEQLEPGDHVLFYTDGVIEARTPDGEFFGLDRLIELATKNLASHLSPAETIRRLVRSILEHQQGLLDDDATLLMAKWIGPS
jgi:hypothetical protein